MTRILLVAEGPTDSGGKTYDKKKGKDIDNNGALQVLIRNCIDGPAPEIVCASHKDVKSFQLFPKERRLSPNEAMRRKYTRYAKSKECTGIARHMDADKEGFSKRYEFIVDLLSEARDQGMKCVPIVPTRMLESWLLADEGSFPSPPTNPTLPEKPEQIWGAKKDTSSNYPKHYLGRVLAQFHMKPNRVTFAELAGNASVKTLRQKCPESFERFYNDVQCFTQQDS